MEVKKGQRFSNNIIQPYIFYPHYTIKRDISLWKTLYLIFSVYTNFCNKTLYHFQFFSIYFNFRTEWDPWILKFILFCIYREFMNITSQMQIWRTIIYNNWLEPNSKFCSWLMKNFISVTIATTSHYKLCEGLWSLVYKGRSKRSGIKHWRSPSGLGFC